MREVILYHFTRREHIHSVFTRGLVINSNERGFTREPRLIKFDGIEYQPIWLTPYPSAIVNTQLGKTWKDYILLKVRVSVDEVKLLRYSGRIKGCREYYKYSAIEFNVFSDIPADSISIVKQKASLS